MLEIRPVRAFRDNYLWLAHDEDGGAFVVDPGDAEPVQQALETSGLTLRAIVVTHHHFDHTGGVRQLAERWSAPVYGPRNPAIEGITRPVDDGDRVEVLGTTFDVIAVPGHTLDHVAYFAADADGGPVLFCGDTLFAGGCGRLFEGTAEQMHASLSRLAALPPATRVYCAHEYTLANLRFARAVEPGNAALEARLARDEARRERDEPTVPTTVGEELETNPFLRCSEPAVIRAAAERDREPPAAGAATLAIIRRWKDEF